MQFLIIGHDGRDPDAPSRRLAAREAHLELGDQMRERGELLYAVAKLNDAGDMVGSVLIVDFSSRESLDAWLKTEPYVAGKVWEWVDVQPCCVGPSFAR
ncbi:MAG: hypothetical protein HY552_03650 [Elusimicrobia bacterium]|nr:hypothetical protein [Elusimicrobiota bacterium]